jgi:ribonuclease VapC
MSRPVLDSSALLAVLNDESGAEKLTVTLLSDAIISTVNLAEVQSKLVEYGIDTEEAWEAAVSSIGEAAVFTSEQARIAGSLISQTRSLGLSLGDRACLALAIARKAPVYTADTTWKKLKLNLQIHFIR